MVLVLWPEAQGRIRVKNTKIAGRALGTGFKKQNLYPGYIHLAEYKVEIRC